MTVNRALELVQAFNPGDDDLARKSRELVIGLLRSTENPFSRNQFTPGHITCTAVVRHPVKSKILFMHHHRLERWLLPGGHVEASDASLAETAAREAHEETLVEIDTVAAPRLVGIDVHGIPPKRKRNEPYHLHHDLIWSFRALHDEIAITDEAPSVLWAGESEWAQLEIAESIRRSIRRAC
ncbi:MAG TPA: NUDIX domain-containing protein [Bryobacteraceae bacterium]|nr:NUDIX domain-containing protein [Bryobacteraceae bacterium]